MSAFALLTTDDKNIPIEAQRFMAERAGADTVEISASHAVSVSEPEAVADLIVRAVERWYASNRLAPRGIAARVGVRSMRCREVGFGGGARCR